MILESGDIFNRRINKRDLGIDPWDLKRLQPASYEISLSPQFLIFDPTVTFIDSEHPGDYTRWVNIDDDEQPWYDLGAYILRPGEFVLGPVHPW